MDNFSEPSIVSATTDDAQEIENLYRIVSAHGGLARKPNEIHLGFGLEIVEKCLKNGIILLIKIDGVFPLAGVIHASRPDIADLRHVMNQVTILIRPELQGQGLGKKLFKRFLSVIREQYPDIYRVELRTRASNKAGIRLYTELNFVFEGKFLGRIRGTNGELEDGYPMAWFNPEK
jgi:GNAT superfamily N-acetyltransferase